MENLEVQDIENLYLALSRILPKDTNIELAVCTRRGQDFMDRVSDHYLPRFRLIIMKHTHTHQNL